MGLLLRHGTSNIWKEVKNMVKRNLLKSKMALVEKSCSECAEALNISSSAYSRKLNGLNEFTVKQANELSQYLALTIPETIDIFLT